MTKEELQNFITEGHKTFMRHLSIDCAVFGYHENELRILLLKWKGTNKWSLPGGHIKHEEQAEEAASRLLAERTGIRDKIFFQQYHTFTSPDRTRLPGLGGDVIENLLGVTFPPDSWLLQRTISMGYYALVDYLRVVDPQPDGLTEICAWCEIHKLPSLLFDHKEMIHEALKALKLQLTYQPIGLNLLPKEFTMGEIQKLYETILDIELDRANFRKKILGLGILKKTGERRTGKAHKTPHLYTFDKRAYTEALKSGISFQV